jgi:hypothetical protein
MRRRRENLPHIATRWFAYFFKALIDAFLIAGEALAITEIQDSSSNQILFTSSNGRLVVSDTINCIAEPVIRTRKTEKRGSRKNCK